MSISHKAWLFDHDSFQSEFADLLYRALTTGNESEIKAFIATHHAALQDPWTEESLGPDWEQQLRTNPSLADTVDLQFWADLALAKYYRADDEQGLDRGFDALRAYLRTVPGVQPHADALIEGYPFGPPESVFDPGRQGTGLVSTAQVKDHHERLLTAGWPPIPGPDSPVYRDCHYRPRSATAVQEVLDHLRDIYQQATEQGRGLLLADFHD